MELLPVRPLLTFWPVFYFRFDILFTDPVYWKLDSIWDVKSLNFLIYPAVKEISNIQFYCVWWIGKMDSEVMMFPRLSDNRRHRRNHHKEDEEEESKAAVREGSTLVKSCVHLANFFVVYNTFCDIFSHPKSIFCWYFEYLILISSYLAHSDQWILWNAGNT